MAKYSPSHYSTGIDTVVTQGKGEATVLTTRGPNNEYIEARVTEKYNELGEKTIESIESIKTNIKDPANLEAAIQSLEQAISIAPGYNWMAEPLADITRRTASLIKNRQRQMEEAIEDAFNGRPIDGVKEKMRGASTVPSPIILDLDGDGIETTSTTHGVLFDHGADGFAELTAWVASDDGLLVREALLHKPGTQVAWFEVLTDPPSNAEARNEAVQNEELEGVQRGTEIPRLAEHLAG